MKFKKILTINSKSLKNILTINFKSLGYNKINFQIKQINYKKKWIKINKYAMPNFEIFMPYTKMTTYFDIIN